MFGHIWKFIKTGWEMIKEAHEYYWALGALGLTIPVSIPLWLSWENPASRGPLFGLAIVLWAILFLCLLGYSGYRENKKAASNVPLTASIKATEQLKLLKLEDYWKDDFPNTLRFSQDLTFGMIENNNEKKFIIKFQVYQDYKSNTKFIGFYIPAINDTYGLCTYLAEHYKNFMDDADKGLLITSKSPADHSPVKSQNLTFSNLVYIYHETTLSLEQLGTLTALYRSKNSLVQFRGSDYVTTRYLQSKDAPSHETNKP